MLKEAIQSVQAQNYPKFEHIIIDGGSTDGTLELLAYYPHLQVVSAPDRGMYDALNKGLDLATGEIIGFLNADDLYADNVFSDIAVRFDSEEVMAVAGRAIVFYKPLEGEAEIIDRYSPEDSTLLECSTIGSNYFNAWFFRKSVFQIIGNFNIEYRIAGDRDLMLRFALNELCYVTIKRLVYRYRKHPGSLTFDDTDQKSEWSTRDYLLMTSQYLNEGNLSGFVKKLLIQVRTRKTMEMAIRTFRVWNFRKSAYYFSEGIKYDLLWPLKFAWLAFWGAINRVINFSKKQLRILLV